jgi:hypothetical protein
MIPRFWEDAADVRFVMDQVGEVIQNTSRWERLALAFKTFVLIPSPPQTGILLSEPGRVQPTVAFSCLQG